MLLSTLLLCLTPFALGQPEDVDWQEYADLEDFMTDLDVNYSLPKGPQRVPRQVKTQSKGTQPRMQELSVKTTIISRYAFTAVSCTLFNQLPAATQGVFQFHVPAAAYVTNFTMIVGGRVYPSQVKPKEKKVKQPKKTSEGKSDSQPKEKDPKELSDGEMELFRMAVTIPGRNRAVFLLTYEELLHRRLGHYEHVTSVRPMQFVGQLNVNVTIIEHSRITHLEVLPLRKTPVSTGKPGKPTLPVATMIRQNETFCKISFSPNIIQQAKLSTKGILGDFIVRYDVEREIGIGDIQVLDGHFVHYFAPKDLPVVPKNVVFVIDSSASMLGTKIKQTKDALFTILKDLRPIDHFNFVTFSNKIRVWQPGKLVPVTPINVRDAKRFIYMITPSGGTDINGAIQTGSSLLSDYLAEVKDSRHGVSLIIFLTDGRPTVGLVESPGILGNMASAVQGQFCVFTIGMGADVDYRLLERMALENCGTMRRIPEDADASTMLKGFYNEIGTPLLSDIRVDYSAGTVDYVTRHLFPNYFNGSEIVVAGKLTDHKADALHVQITASSSERTVVMETDVALQERERETEQRLAEAEATGDPGVDGYVERLWGFLSVKDGLRDRLRSQSGREREGIARRVANVSLAYNFLTPLTEMVVEKPQVQADGTLAEPEAAETEDKRPSEEEEEEGVGEEGGGKAGSMKDGSGQSSAAAKVMSGVVKKAAKKSVTLSKTSADGDPHFVVEFPMSKLTVCFNINGEPGHILRLVTDHKHSGVTVNGKLIGAPAPAGSHKELRTYFSSIIIVVDKPRRSYIEITPKKVILDGRDRMLLPCSSSVSVESDDLGVAIVANANVTVTVDGTIGFVILLHLYKNPAPYQRDHLGFYISKSKGLSKDTHGLLGQFLYEDITLTELPRNVTTTTGVANQTDSSPPRPALKVKDRTVAVAKKTRRIYAGKQIVDCWFAKNNAAKLIDGQYEDYVVSHLFDTGDWPHGSNGL